LKVAAQSRPDRGGAKAPSWSAREAEKVLSNQRRSKMVEGKTLIIRPEDAVLNVDVQPTFMPGGGLPVAGGDEIVPVVGRVSLLFAPHRRYFTLDRHPLGHISLASSYVGLTPGTLLKAEEAEKWRAAHEHLAPQARFRLKDLKRYLRQVGGQMLWPDHGIAGTAEAELHPGLVGMPCQAILDKGGDPRCDSYSAFRDNLRRPTGLHEKMAADGVKRIFLTGLALDFCVGESAVDAVDYGFEAFVVEDATRAVNMLPHGSFLGLTTDDLIRFEFKDKGVQLIQSEHLIVGR